MPGRWFNVSIVVSQVRFDPDGALAEAKASGRMPDIENPFVLKKIHIPGSPFRIRVRSGPSYPQSGEVVQIRFL